VSQFVESNPDDDDCLIRPYLGRRRRSATNTSQLHRFSLRNVPLHVDQMEELELDDNVYADTMANALALMHWSAKVDANGVEFVLAPPRSGSLASSTLSSQYLGEHTMWLLDFNCCRAMAMDEQGVNQACAAFFRNDPFYPRPGGKETADRVLWERFKGRFLETSRRIFGEGSDIEELPGMLMERIEDLGREKEKKEELRERDGKNGV
jgi:hypothetical protein